MLVSLKEHRLIGWVKLSERLIFKDAYTQLPKRLTGLFSAVKLAKRGLGDKKSELRPARQCDAKECAIEPRTGLMNARVWGWRRDGVSAPRAFLKRFSSADSALGSLQQSHWRKRSNLMANFVFSMWGRICPLWVLKHYPYKENELRLAPG